MSLKEFSLSLGLLVFIGGCQSIIVPQAREVKKKPQKDGVIAMPTNYNKEDRNKAEEIMTRNCVDLKVKIIDEGEVVIGQTTTTNSSSTHRDDTRRETGSFFGVPIISGGAAGIDSQNTSVTSQTKEWQIVYECESGNLKSSTITKAKDGNKTSVKK